MKHKITLLQKIKMIMKALKKYGYRIRFCDGKNLKTSFTIVLDIKKRVFWFNDADGSTHIIAEKIN